MACTTDFMEFVISQKNLAGEDAVRIVMAKALPFPDKKKK